MRSVRLFFAYAPLRINTYGKIRTYTLDTLCQYVNIRIYLLCLLQIGRGRAIMLTPSHYIQGHYCIVSGGGNILQDVAIFCYAYL
jgi:hypothetical protein